MAKIEFAGFRGIQPRMNPTMLEQSVAQTANNCQLFHRDLRPLKNPAPVVTPAPRTGGIASIYRIGQSLGETQFWLTWSTDVNVVRGIVADDPDERTYFTGDGYPKYTTLPLATQGGTSYPVTSYRLGIPRPLAKMSFTIVPSGSSTVSETRVYVYTYVNSLGEEGAISPPTSVVCMTSDHVDLAGMSVAPTGNYNITTKRIYRSANIGANAGAFFFEGEVAVGVATFSSVKTSAELSEPLSTADYDPPPDTLQGIVALPNGIFAGFSGYDVYFCEPNHPYAWPAKYRQTMDYPVVGLSTFGASLVVATKGTPYILSGSHPDSISAEKVELDQACVSKRSIVSTGGGVVYASPDGLIYVGTGGSKILTEDSHSREEWQAIGPSAIIGCWTDGKYFGITPNGSFILNSLEDREFVTFDDSATALYVDKVNDSLYFCIGGGIVRYNAGSPKTLTWKSKRMLANQRPAPKCAKVEASAYPVAFRLYADGVLKYTQTVQSSAVFRLPNGYRARHLEVEISGTQQITYVGLADEPTEFRNG